MLNLSDADFQRLYVYIQKNYGIDLSKKKELIVSRLSNTLSASGYKDFSAYVNDIVSGKDKEGTITMLNKLTTNYTYFLREEEHFAFMENTVLPAIARSPSSVAVTFPHGQLPQFLAAQTVPNTQLETVTQVF